MGIVHRMLGICRTKPPTDPSCWKVSGTTLTIDLQKAPELTSAGGAIRIEGPGIARRVLVLKGDDGQYHALVNNCGHGGRRLDPLVGTNTVQCCSVGKSVFDYSGKRLSGSSRKDIRPLEIQLLGKTLTVIGAI